MSDPTQDLFPETGWFKSTYSGDNNGACVEANLGLMDTAGVVGVRDSKNPGAGHLAVPAAAWRAWLAKVPPLPTSSIS